MERRVELLSPAGDRECFFAALNAGADAVYAGLKKFGARNFAANFSTEEFIEAIDHAHLFGKKVYLTLNILLKDSELSEALSSVFPLYRAGLDGVIVQDIGLMSLLRKEYPLLEVHGSTQAFITGPKGAALLKELGVTRVVPARELSIEEIRLLKEETGIEVECFIHGAMCYSYSGMCLMSSFLGGRSGNRGRCAGPCRQPLNGNDYLLSMKDLCALGKIPDLIEAGVDSFKIEGRMKPRDYVYNVTRIYRKYIDRYYDTGRTEPDKKDMEELISIYSRSGSCGGYFDKHNGGDMITRQRGSYVSTKEGPESMDKLTLPVKCEASFKKDEKARLCLISGSHRVSVVGSEVMKAENRPVAVPEIEKLLKRSGDSGFSMEEIRIEADPDIFIPVSRINELRRQGISALKEDILNAFRR